MKIAEVPSKAEDSATKMEASISGLYVDFSSTSIDINIMSGGPVSPFDPESSSKTLNYDVEFLIDKKQFQRTDTLEENGT